MRRNAQNERGGDSPLDALPVVEADFNDWLPEWARDDLSANDERGAGSGLTTRERRFLELVTESPGPCSTFPERLGMSTATAIKVRKTLTESGYINEEKISGGRGRPCIHLVVTDRGRELIDSFKQKGADA